MSKRKKREGKRKSLARAVVGIMTFVAVMIFLVATLLNFVFTQFGVVGLFTISGQSMAGNLARLVTIDDGFTDYAAEVLAVWQSIPEEIRSNPESDEYRAFFTKFADYPYYKTTRRAMSELLEEKTITDSYVVLYDRLTKKLIYILSSHDTEDGSTYCVGNVRELTKNDQVDFRGRNEGPREFFGNRETQFQTRARQTEEENLPYTIGSMICSIPGGADAYAMNDISLENAEKSALRYTILYFVLLAGIITVIMFIARHVLKRRLVRPVNTISKAAEEYIADRSEGRSERMHFDKLDIHTGNELEELGNLLGVMERDIAVYEENLMKQTAEQERIKTELSLASRIQKGVVPQESAFPERKDIDIYGYTKPAREIGGDFYDFFLIDDDHLGIVIADVSGKGVPAALFMMSAKIIINSFAMLGYTPKEVMEMSNERICRTNRNSMFVTVWFGILNLKTGVITAVNAGHNDPVICRNGRWEILPSKHHDFVLGGMNGTIYRESTIPLAPGGGIFIYTSGLTEAAEFAGRVFGIGRMLDALQSCGEATPEETVKEMKNRVRKFVGRTPQDDDMTMLCMKWEGK